MLFLSTLILVAFAVVLLAIRILFAKDGRFPNTHVGGQKALRERGISCHTSQHREALQHRSLSERMADEE